MKKISKILAIVLSVPVLTYANYLSLGESGESIGRNNYRVGASLQSLSAGKAGLNAGTFLDMGYNDDLSSRFLFGVGSVDFHLGGTLKYIPFPDFQNQPAIGFRAAAWVARIADTSTTALQFSPLISKKVAIEKGDLTPYLGIPLNMVFTKNTQSTGAQFVVGSEYQHSDLENVLFAGEVNLNLNNSESGFTLFASIPFDAEKGFQRRHRSKE